MFGQRLRLARKRAGLSMRSLAEQMTPKVTAQAISKYEAGKMLPSSGVLVGLGRALDVSLDFLMSAQVEALDALEFRKHSSTSARDRAKAEAILIDNLERYLAVEDVLDMPATLDWFEGRRYDSVATAVEIDAKADALRNAWRLGMDPIPSLCELLEDKGIKVVEDDLPESINGLACHVLRGGKPVAEAVLVSSRINVERKRFTLAHELAHRIIRLHRESRYQPGDGNEPLRRSLPGPRSGSPGGSRHPAAPHYLLRNHPPQAHLRRFRGGHASPPRADRRPGPRHRPACLCDFRALLAQDGTGTHQSPARVRGLREAPAFQAPCLSRRRRRSDLARACRGASR